MICQRTTFFQSAGLAGFSWLLEEYRRPEKALAISTQPPTNRAIPFNETKLINAVAARPPSVADSGSTDMRQICEPSTVRTRDPSSMTIPAIDQILLYFIHLDADFRAEIFQCHLYLYAVRIDPVSLDLFVKRRKLHS